MRFKPSFSSRLYNQIAVPFIAVSILMAVVTAGVALYLLQDLTQNWSSQVTETTNSGVVLHYDQYASEMRSISRLLSEHAAIRAAADRGDVDAMRSIVASEALLLPYGSEEIVDVSTGRVVASAGPAAIGAGSALLPLPRAGEPARGTVLSKAGILTAFEPLGSTRRFALALSTRIDDAWLARLTDETEGAFCFYSLDRNRLACTVRNPDRDSGSASVLVNSLTQSNSAVQAVLQSASANGAGETDVAIEGVGYRVRAVPVRSSGPDGVPVGYLMSAVSESLTEQTARNSVRTVIVGALVAVIALIGLGFWVARRVSDPLVELADGAQRIAIGDFSTKVPVRHGTSEIELLGETFNDMTDSLRERSESLTKKVLELATLYEMSRALGSTLDMDELLGSTLDSALRIFDLDVGYVALRDRDAGALEIRAVRGASAHETAGTEAVRSSMADWVVREGRPLIFNPDPGAEAGQVDALTGAKAALCVPLVSSEGTIGAITVGSSDASYRFNSDDVRLLSTIGNHVTIAVGNIELFSSLQEAYIATVRSLAAAVDAKDTYTRGHSDKVATYATLIAETMGLGHDQLTALEMAAYLHDIGKIGVPEAILLKPGRLSDEEMAQMRHHPLIGANILKPVAFPWAITPIVRHHHEFWDGKGYPAGLKGEEIPLLARILCVADSYEAMTADRPYRAGRSAADAIEELHRCAGSQFDPRVVAVMTAVIEDLEREGSGVLSDMAEDVSAEEARAIFSALVDGVMSSFRRLGGPRLASNAEGEIDDYFRTAHQPYRMARGRLTFTAEPPAEPLDELDDMRMSLRRIDAIIGRVSGGTLVDHFYEDALEGFSARMRRLAVALAFHETE
jgi:putative nucleotidyltransferase with HDIG domain